jgi:hypothetical protein
MLGLVDGTSFYLNEKPFGDGKVPSPSQSEKRYLLGVTLVQTFTALSQFYHHLIYLTYYILVWLSNMSNTLTVEKAESLVRLMTDGLVNIVDKTGEFLLKRKSSDANKRWC